MSSTNVIAETVRINGKFRGRLWTIRSGSLVATGLSSGDAFPKEWTLSRAGAGKLRGWCHRGITLADLRSGRAGDHAIAVGWGRKILCGAKALAIVITAARKHQR